MSRSDRGEASRPLVDRPRRAPFVIPAQAGIQATTQHPLTLRRPRRSTHVSNARAGRSSAVGQSKPLRCPQIAWIPACAGMTEGWEWRKSLRWSSASWGCAAVSSAARSERPPARVVRRGQPALRGSLPLRRPARKSHCSDLPCRWRCREVKVGSFRYLVRARPEPPSACGISPRFAGGEEIRLLQRIPTLRRQSRASIPVEGESRPGSSSAAARTCGRWHEQHHPRPIAGG